MPLAVRTWQMGSNMRREQEQEQQEDGGGGLPRRVIRIRWRIPCGDDTEYLTSAWKRKRKPNGASVAQFNLFPAPPAMPTNSLSRSAPAHYALSMPADPHNL